MTVREYVKDLMKLFESCKDKQPNYYFYKWVLEKGRPRKTTKFSKKELKFIREQMKRLDISIQAKECYYVSQLVSFAINDFKYIEGYANDIIPTEHAWLEYHGKVLDVVWGSLSHSKSPDGFSASPNCEYFGVEVNPNLIMENVAETEMAQPILPIMFMKDILPA